MDEFITKVSKEGLWSRIHWEMRHGERAFDDADETEAGSATNWREERDKDIMRTYANPVGKQRSYTRELDELLESPTADDDNDSILEDDEQ